MAILVSGSSAPVKLSDDHTSRGHLAHSFMRNREPEPPKEAAP